MRRELGVTDEVMVLHCSNLRPVKRIDLLLEAAARIRPRESFKLVILAGEDFAPFADDVRRLGLEDRVIVLEQCQRHRRLPAGRRPGAVHVGNRELLPEHPRGDVLRLPERRDARRRDPEVVEDGVTGSSSPPATPPRSPVPSRP